MYVRTMGTTVMRAMTALRAAYEAFAACDVESLTRTELMAVMDEYETLTCQLPAQSHRMLARLQAETTAKELGAASWNDVLRVRWRLSKAEAGRRLGEAAMLGPRRALTGEPLPPALAAVAAAQAAGLINADHVKVLREAIDGLPAFVDTTPAQQFEVDLVRVAARWAPRNSRTPRSSGCSCSIRTDPNPMTPNGREGAASPSASRAATR